MIDIHLYAVNLQALLVKTVLEQSVITSTLLLTLLLMVGLFFFIRASIKDRTEQVELLAKEPEESIFERLQTYFEQRAYRITTVMVSIILSPMKVLFLPVVLLLFF